MKLKGKSDNILLVLHTFTYLLLKDACHMTEEKPETALSWDLGSESLKERVVYVCVYERLRVFVSCAF